MILREYLDEWLKKVRPLVHLPFVIPSVNYKYSLRFKGGEHFGYAKVININPDLTPAHQREVVGHELAHALAYQVDHYPGGHGGPWRAWMIRLGLKPRRLHNYPELLDDRPGEWYGCLKCGEHYKFSTPIQGRIHKDCGGLFTIASLTAAAQAAEKVTMNLVVSPEIARLLTALAATHSLGVASGQTGRSIRRRLRRLGYRGGLSK